MTTMSMNNRVKIVRPKKQLLDCVSSSLDQLVQGVRCAANLANKMRMIMAMMVCHMRMRMVMSKMRMMNDDGYDVDVQQDKGWWRRGVQQGEEVNDANIRWGSARTASKDSGSGVPSSCLLIVITVILMVMTPNFYDWKRKNYSPTSSSQSCRSRFAAYSAKRWSSNHSEPAPSWWGLLTCRRLCQLQSWWWCRCCWWHMAKPSDSSSLDKRSLKYRGQACRL